MKTKARINKKEITSKKAGMSLAQILILIISSFAFAYIIYQSSAPLETQSEITENSENTSNTQSESNWEKITEVLMKFIIQKLKQPILPIVSAQEDPLANWACCEKNNNGAFCTFRPKEECNTNFKIAPTECEETEFCKQGCCIGNSGICSANTPKTNCNGAWIEQASCYIQECKRGCCILGDESRFITEKECNVKAGELGILMDFRNEINSEVSCLYLTEGEIQGACVIETGDIIITRNCIYTTSSNCDTRKGNFYANIFCSNSELNTTCKAKDHTGCVENKDEVYWFDSCNNKEEVKEACSIFLGTRCGQYRPNVDTKPDIGDYVCRDLSCNVEIDGKIVNKKNGESWCEYEGCIGEGKDPVGSRHIRHICYMGEEKTEACDDFRNQLCVQSDTELADGKIFSEASCRVNRWRSCYEYNNEKAGMAEKCNENPDCIIKGVHIDKFSFDVCVPNYPPGFEFWNTEDASRSGELECSFATQKCPVVYVKRISGWKCEMNCDCLKSTFTQQMNDLCISLGDCGGYINFNGDYTDDGYTSGAGRINGNQYKYCAEYQPNQKPAEPGDFPFSQILGIPEGIGEGDVPGPSLMIGMLGAGVGALGYYKFGVTTSLVSSISGVSTATYVSSTGETYTGAQAIAEGWLDVNPITGETLGTFQCPSCAAGEKVPVKTPSAFGNALASVGAGLAVASFMQVGFGMDAGASYAIGGVVGVATYSGLQAGAAWAGYMVWVGIGLMIAQLIFGWGKTKIKYVQFTCMPWQPETGGLNCDLCNTKDELGVQCSEYRCKSLGQTCEFINPRTLDERCVSVDPNDVSSPRIKPLYNNITQGYEYKNVNDNSFEIKSIDNECIPEYTLLNFGIETDKPARCKIGNSAMQTYDEMEEFFGGKNSFIIEHKMQLVVPSPSAFKNIYNLTDEEVEAMGRINYFVKCENVNGISNIVPFAIKTCVKPGPDLTAPRITKAIPEIGYVKYRETEKEIQIYTNEPAECRYSAEDKKYEDMKNSINCMAGFEDYGLLGWPCIANLTGIDTNSKFYIRCKDQPWLGENTLRNAMTESYEYNLVISSSPLTIEDFRPENGKEIFSGVEPVVVELKIKTSGGVDGTSTCKWEGNGYSDDFREINEQYHSYTLTSITRGDYNIKFVCEDKAGNTAENSTLFKIKIDSSGPKITRIYNQGGLKIITDENAVCGYSLDNCNFEIENVTLMDGQEKEHSADWQTENIYYIKCKDNYGNKPGGCSIIVRAYDIT